MTAPNRIQQNFDRAASRYDQHAALQRDHAHRVLDYALQWFPEKAAIADIGCGTGYFSSMARSIRPEWRMTGLDYAFAMAKQAKPRCHYVLQADAVNLPLADGSLDGVISSLCLQWVTDKTSAMAEMKRVLKPMGTAIITSFGQETLRELRQSMARTATPLGLLEMLTLNEWKNLAEQSGMEVIVCQHAMETRTYSSVEALLDSMRTIGAGNAQATKEPLTPGKFTRLSQRYEADFGSARGIPATWETVWIALRNR